MNHIWTKMLAVLLAAVAIGLGASPAKAAFVNATDRGWYDDTGFHDPSNLNYIAGFDRGTQYRDFFVFDLSGISNPIISASLRLWNPSNGTTGPGTFQVSDVSTPIPSLTAGGSGQTATFNDLGTGTSFGSVAVSTADNGTFVTVNLNASALAFLNANLGNTIAFGGQFITSGNQTFAFTNSNILADTQLIYEAPAPNVVPAPAGIVLFGLGLTGLGGFRLFRRKSAVPGA